MPDSPAFGVRGQRSIASPTRADNPVSVSSCLLPSVALAGELNPISTTAPYPSGVDRRLGPLKLDHGLTIYDRQRRHGPKTVGTLQALRQVGHRPLPSECHSA